jgi:3-deoxy-D-manno-octulosonate 8-phosphate phosphatase (KDO 8-P phosphatase)
VDGVIFDFRFSIFDFRFQTTLRDFFIFGLPLRQRPPLKIRGSNNRRMPQSKIENRKSKIPPAKWRAVRLFAMDVDGVLTDGRVLVSSAGAEAKFFSILDGFGLASLRKTDVAIAWISGRPSPATTTRAGELGIAHLIQGQNDKLSALQNLARKLGLDATQCAYMGDDLIDIPGLTWAGIGIAPPNAMPDVLKVTQYVTNRSGGHGAVREVCDHLLAARTPAKTSRIQTRPARSHSR